MSPKTTNPKNIQLNVLISQEEANAIETLSKELGVSKSELVRSAVSEFIARNVKVLIRKIELEVEALQKAKKKLEELMEQDPTEEVYAYDIEGLCEVFCKDCDHLKEYGHCVKWHDENICRQWGCLRSVEEWYLYITQKLSELGKKLAQLRAL